MLSGKVGYFRKSGPSVDPAIAPAYIAAVEAADGMSLEPAVSLAITSFIDGCQADGIWTALKASCLLLGARTLSGALCPLVGPAPTSINFVSGDYNRKTGLLGSAAAAKRLNINRTIDADPTASFHQAVFCTQPGAQLTGLMGSGIDSRDANRSVLKFTSSGFSPISRGVERVISSGPQSGSGMKLLGSSRNSSTVMSACFGTTVSVGTTGAAQAPLAGWPHGVFCMFTGLAATHTVTHSARLSFYSTGTAVNLLLLHNRLTTLHSAIGAAIP